MPYTQNGSATWRWVLGILLSALIGVGSMLYAQTRKDIDKLDDVKATKAEVQVLTRQLDQRSDRKSVV